VRRFHASRLSAALLAVLLTARATFLNSNMALGDSILAQLDEVTARNSWMVTVFRTSFFR
jgi:hypothetical protein